MTSDLQDKVVVLTGASSGIGAALAPLLSDRGAAVVLVARREDKLDAVASLCPGEVLTVAADVTEEKDRHRACQAALERWGRIDILVNNAGLGCYGDFAEMTDGQWRSIFEVNLFAPVALTRAVLPAMKERGQGLIVNMASIGALVAHSPKVAPYVASKHALLGFTRGLARDLKGSGVRAIAVCPHMTDTELFESSFGADAMAPVVAGAKEHMDSAEAVALGTVEAFFGNQTVCFPTAAPAKAYEKLKDL